MLFVNGELRVIYINADESIIKKVDEAFRQIGYRYDFDHVRLKNGVKVNGWGNESYSETRIKKLLDSLKAVAPIEEGSEFDFNDGDGNYWRYIFGKGNWIYQTGKLVYEDGGIFDTVKDCIEEYLFGYDFEFEIGDYEIIVRAWGNDRYGTEETEEMLEKLKTIAPLKVESEYDFKGEDNEFWRFILKNGEWWYQEGRIVYDE